MIREFSTLADETALVAHYRELGFGNRLIAEATGIRRSRVCYLQRKLGYSSKVFPPELRGFRPFPPETVAKAIELRKQGVSSREIGIAIGVPADDAYNLLYRQGWRANTSPIQERGRPLTTPEQTAEILRLSDQKLGRRTIARRLQMRDSRVREALLRAGRVTRRCTGKPPAQIRGDVSYLDLTPGVAWSFGLIFGDGSLSRERRQISLTSGDRDVVEKFACLHGTPTIVQRGNAWTVTLSSARLYRELQTYGLGPKKSAMLQFPKLAADLMPHFVRGLIDSDGSFYPAGKTRNSHLLRFDYACICEPFMHDLRDVLIQHGGVSPKRPVVGRQQTDTPNKVWKVKYSHADAVKIGHWAYAVSTDDIRCSRKFNKWNLAKDHVLPRRGSKGQ